MKYSVVVPVYNSRQTVGELTERAISVLNGIGEEFEIVLVDDGSSDGSWDIVTALATAHPQITGIRLRRNMGQQYATLCGAQHSLGDYIITIDDDLQQSPEDIPRLIEAMAGEFDIAFAVFRKYRKGPSRRLGSFVLSTLIRKIHGLPKGFKASSFRIARRSLVLKVAEFPTVYPHINSIALSMKPRVINVPVDQMPRAHGRSGYSSWRLAKLLMAVLYNCPRYPLKALSIIGGVLIAVAIAGFAITGAMSAQPQLIKYTLTLGAALGIFALSASLGGLIAFRVVASKTPRPDYTAQVETLVSEPTDRR